MHPLPPRLLALATLALPLRAVADDRRIHAGLDPAVRAHGDPVWCFDQRAAAHAPATFRVSACFDQHTCDGRRAGAERAGLAPSACTQSPVVWCMTATRPGQPADVHCYPGASGQALCNATRDRLAAHNGAASGTVYARISVCDRITPTAAAPAHP